MSGIFSLNFSRLILAVNLARRAFGSYKKQILVITILGFLGGLLEAVGVNALIPLFSFFIGGEDRLGTDFVTSSIQRVFAFFHLPFNLPIILVFICAMFILKAVVGFYFDYVRVNIRAEYERRMMDSLYRDTLAADWSYLSKQKIGHLETVIMTDVHMSGGLLETIARTIGVVSAFLMYLVVAVNISKTVTVVTLVLGVVIFLIFKPLLFKLRRFSEQTEHLNKEVSHHVNESISGMKVIKALGNEAAFIKTSSFYFDLLRRLQMRAFAVQNISGSVIQPIGVVFISAVVAFAYYQTSYNLGALAAIIYLIQKMFGYVQSLQAFAQQISGTVPFVQGVLNYKEQAGHFLEVKNGSAGVPFSFARELSFENVSFAYDRGRRVLEDVSFKIKKGSMVGIIGKSGAGKTTVFDLLLRLLNPSQGRITVDGVPAGTVSLPEWRNKLVYVPQDSFLLHDTIYNNIVFFGENISRTDVENAAKAAHLGEFISELPKGYETLVGERGMKLSGGQRQRIAIARALVRHPEILLLDEATSALDAESEKYIRQAIEGLKGKMTIVIIAHRLSTVAESDNLIVLEKGRIVETGSPREMLKDKETYYSRLYDMKS